MKKVFMFFVLLLATSTALTAQVFVGGGLGFSSDGGKTTTGSTEIKDPTTTSFSFQPTVGYFLNDKFAFGLSLAIGGTNISGVNAFNQDYENKTTSWSVFPFARYYFLTFDKLSFYAQGSLMFGGQDSSVTVGSTTTNSPYVAKIGFNVFPAVQYCLSDNLGLFANLNFLSLNYTHSSQKDEDANPTVTKETDSFNFGVNADNVLSTSAFTIGFFYKF